MRNSFFFLKSYPPHINPRRKKSNQSTLYNNNMPVSTSFKDADKKANGM
ncbi:hypothetical protein OAV88_00385 [bacterium]|nr:hypothetical protein [bacterium]